MKWKWIGACTVFLIGTLVGYGISFIFSKYRIEDVMILPIKELSPLDYPDNPATLSTYYEKYTNRTLRLVHKGGTVFDFHFESINPSVAKISLVDIDLAYFVPTIPLSLKKEGSLEKIALTEREWNRQQVSFSLDSPHLNIEGGDGFEQKFLLSAELARNSLQAGLWEILLYTQEQGKTLYYQGWFSFPLGHYKNIFEKINLISYWKYWHHLEHRFNLDGKKVELEKLRSSISEKEISFFDQRDERIFASGEQLQKLRTFSAKEVLTWKDFVEKGHSVAFATFVPPGYYKVNTHWGNQYHKISRLEKVIKREIKAPLQESPLTEIECLFYGDNTPLHLFIGGFDVESLPSLAVEQYSEGYQMPFGISLPPVYQTYIELTKAPPLKNPFFSLFLDNEFRFIDHKTLGIDGVILHKDLLDPSCIHLYLLSYERHTLISHYKMFYR